MAQTFLEQTRGMHEDLERLERLIVKDYLRDDVRTHRDRLLQAHRVRRRMDEMQAAASKLARVYEDGTDEARHRREEIAALGGGSSAAEDGGADGGAEGGGGVSGAPGLQPQVYDKFYARLRELRDYHRRYPSLDVTGGADEAAAAARALLDEAPPLAFSGEEGLGRYLDLHEHHRAFCNLGKGFGSRQVEYLDYLRQLGEFGAVPKHERVRKPYRDYLEALLAYLVSFYERTQPLSQLGRQLQKLQEEVDAAWDEGLVPGWEDKGLGAGASDEAEAAAARLAAELADAGADAASGAAELAAAWGPDRLKEALASVGLKVGGTPLQRAERLLQLKGRASLRELDPKLFQPGKAPGGAAAALTDEQRRKQEQAARRVAALEAQVARLVELLGNVVSDTRGRVEKKQAQTYEELAAELEEAELDGGGAAGAGGAGGLNGPDGGGGGDPMASDEEEGDDYIYNPLKLPLGWDGKPIPYWLYKLHGLNQEFKCEICGNYSYWGRRAFERHFKEWRHVNGMRALGIPNNKDFYEVTRIADAQALHRAIQARAAGGGGGADGAADEELEDAQGNVYSRKVYDDLKRQGLV